MKESASEANLTVAAIILIAALVCIATPLVGSLMKKQIWRSCCTDQGGTISGSNCKIYENGEIIKTVSKDKIITADHTCVQVNGED